MDYKEKIAIDEDALDIEWLEQPSKMLEVTQEAAECKRLMDEAKDALDLKKADLDYAIRSNPDKYMDEGIKITENVIFATILKQQSYKDANAEYLQAKYEYDVAKGAVEAFEQRKSALENLVKLHGQQYFAGPKVPRNIHDERQAIKQRSKDTDSKIGKKLKRRSI